MLSVNYPMNQIIISILRTGEIFDKDNINDPDFRWMANLPSWLVPKKVITLGYLMKFLDLVHYGKNFCIKEVQSATKIYLGQSVSVLPDGRGKGLGKELMTRSMDLAKNNGCTHMYILASSIYSQAIFRKLG